MEKYILISGGYYDNNTRFRLHIFKGWLSMSFMQETFS